MTILRVERWLLGAALTAAGLVSGGAARAADEPGPSAAASTEGAKKDKPAGEADEANEEPTFELGIDAVIGSSVTTQISQSSPGGSFTQTGAAPTTFTSSARVTTQSFLIGGEWMATKSFGVGVRVPIVSGEIHSSQYSRGSVGYGNAELEAKGKVNLAKDLDLELALGVALPTASGAEFDPASPVVVAGTIDQAAYDRFTIQRAVAMARGYDENALFEPQHLGIIPKIKLEWGQEGKWHLDPWIKLENLIATRDGLQHSYIGELVFGANAGYHVSKEVEPALRIWANTPLSGADFTAVAVAEPQLLFHVGDFTPSAGVILPFAGPLTSPYDIGVRVALAGRF